MNSREALVALNMIPHVGPVRYRQLAEHFRDAPSILAASKTSLMRVQGISDVTAESIASWETSIDLAGELKRIEEFGCHIVTQEDENYPELLRQVYDPPLVLYVKGTLTTRDKNSVAVNREPMNETNRASLFIRIIRFLKSTRPMERSPSCLPCRG